MNDHDEYFPISRDAEKSLSRSSDPRLEWAHLRRFLDPFGTTITKTIVIGEKGSISVSFFYAVGNLKEIPSVVTLIPKIF
jgi:hypothetical protein